MPANKTRSMRVVAALALLALALAPALAAGAETPSYDYRFGWRESAGAYAHAENKTALHRESRVPVNVDDVSNLTQLRFTVSWHDDTGGPSTLHLAVFDPSGRESGPVNATGREDGTMSVLVRIAEVPPGTVTIRASSDEQAWSAFAAKYPATVVGRGTWTVVVGVDDARDDSLLGLGPAPSVAWSLDVDAARYAGVLETRIDVPSSTAPPTPNPTEMPSPDATPAPTPDVPEESQSQSHGFLSTPGMASLLVAGAAVVGIGAAMALARRAPA